MAHTAQELITRSWYLSGIVARNLQIPTGDQITDGLAMFNALLDFKQIEIDLIPYWTYIEFQLTPNQEFYFLPNIAEIETSTFNIGTVRYPMESVSRSNYFGSGRVDNINTLPFDYNYNRGQNGGTLALYFLPQDNYPFKAMVKLFLNDVTLDTDLTSAFTPLASGFVSIIKIINPGSGYTQIPSVTISGTGSGAQASATVTNGQVTSISVFNSGSLYTVPPTVTISGNGIGATAQAIVSSYNFLQTNNAGLDTSYIEYLRYALAQYMCSEYGILFNPESAAILKKYERKLMYMSPPDVSTKKITILTSDRYSGYNYGDVNLGRGWRPS